MEDGDDVVLDGAPAGAEEFHGEAVRAWRFPRRQASDRVPNLLVYERRVQVLQVIGRVDQLLEIERALAGRSHADEIVEVDECGLSHLVLVGEDPVSGGKAEDLVLLSAVGALPVEKRSVSIANFQGCDAGALPSDGALQGRKAEVGELEALVRHERSILLRLVKFEDEFPA